MKERFLEEQREEIGERNFRQEYLAEFVDDDKTYFPMALLREVVHVCEDKTPCEYCSIVSGKRDPWGDLYGGYDPGGMTDPAALVVVQKVPSKYAKGKSVFVVVLTKTFLSKVGENPSKDVYTRFTVEVADIHKRLHFLRLLVDSTGIGNPIVEHCRELEASGVWAESGAREAGRDILQPENHHRAEEDCSPGQT